MSNTHKKNSRIFLGVDNTGGHLWGLHTGFEKKNIQSDVYYLSSSSYFDFPGTYNYSYISTLPKFKKSYKKVHLFLNLLSRYELFHFNNASSILPNYYDIKVLHTLGKPVFFTFNGTRVRPPMYCLNNFKYSQFGVNGIPFINKKMNDNEVLNRINVISKYSNRIFCLNPDLCRHVDNGVFLPYAKYSIYDLPVIKKRDFVNRRIRIGHAPTNRVVKGTEKFLKALEAVSKKIPEYELILIENMSNIDAINLMATCDILFDQLYVGWYGGVAVEAMAMGIPVFCYIREDDLKYIDTQMKLDLPILRVREDTLEDDLYRALSNCKELAEVSERSIEFVWKYHNPEKVVDTVLDIYRKSGVDYER